MSDYVYMTYGRINEDVPEPCVNQEMIQRFKDEFIELVGEAEFNDMYPRYPDFNIPEENKQ